MICAAIAALAAPVASYAAPATSQSASPPIRVKTSDLNLTNRQDSAILLRRIDAAATEACGGWVSSNPIDLQEAQLSECHAAAVGRAVAQVNSPTVNALYEQRASYAMRAD
jgi:UrcA family protein